MLPGRGSLLAPGSARIWSPNVMAVMPSDTFALFQEIRSHQQLETVSQRGWEKEQTGHQSSRRAHSLAQRLLTSLIIAQQISAGLPGSSV